MKQTTIFDAIDRPLGVVERLNLKMDLVRRDKRLGAQIAAYANSRFSLENDLHLARKKADAVDLMTSDLKLERPSPPQVSAFVVNFCEDGMKVAATEGHKEALKKYADWQCFTIEHDWLSALGTTPLDHEVMNPFDRATFEMRVSGFPVCVSRIHEAQLLHIKTKQGWFTPTAEPDHARYEAEIRRLDTFCRKHIDAALVMLDAEVAEAEVVRVDEKLNRARARRGKQPLPDYHIVRLSNRRRVSALNSEPTGRRVRLHFRRGHWRRYGNHKTWINWMLVGDPDLGFVDKEYRL